eukprot:90136-Pyramimonas_sp.AAC.1
MGIPAALVAFFGFQFSGNSAMVTLFGREFSESSVVRGARQGGLSSTMMLFLSAVDPTTALIDWQLPGA